MVDESHKKGKPSQSLSLAKFFTILSIFGAVVTSIFTIFFIPLIGINLYILNPIRWVLGALFAVFSIIGVLLMFVFLLVITVLFSRILDYSIKRWGFWRVVLFSFLATILIHFFAIF